MPPCFPPLPPRESACRPGALPYRSLLPPGVNVGVGEPPEAILLLLQRGVEAQPVEDPGDHDVVGDAGLREFAVPVDAELVDADRLELERLPTPSVLREVLVQHPDRLGELITGHHGAGPAIADA